MSLTKEREYYKPFQYPWAYEAYKQHEQMHWLPEEVPMADDLKDFRQNFSEGHKMLLTQLFKFFTQADVDVAGGYANHYLPTFKPPEIRMALSSIAGREAVHQDAYSQLLETLGFPDDQYQKFADIASMAAKHEYLSNFGMDTPANIAKTLAVYSAFTEGVQLFSSFAILLNFPRHNLMKNMGQIVTWSIRDETLHVEFMSRMFLEYIREHPDIWDDALKYAIYSAAERVVELEDAFIDTCFEGVELPDLTPTDVKIYIRFIANKRLMNIGLKPIFDVKENPLPWIDYMVSGVEHVNFFEGRATEYSKGASEDKWSDIFG